jgi:2-haloacid dehalogenase
MSVIFIDIDNTLLDFNKCSEFSINSAAKDFNIDMPENYYPKFKKINDGLWHRIEQGELTIDGLKKIRFNLVFENLGIKADGPAFEDRYRVYLTQSAIPVDGAKELLEYLGAKYDIYAASNAPKNQQVDRLTTADMAKNIKGFFISEEIGFAKPSKEFFDYCFEKVGNPKPEETYMIGDSINADITGAKAYGMKTILFNYDGKKTGASPADYTVEKLLEIKDIL